LDTGRSQSNHVADTVCIHAGLVGDQTDATIAYEMQAVGQQHVHTRFRARRLRAGAGAKVGGSMSSTSAVERPPPETQQEKRSVQAKYLVCAVILLFACGKPAPVTGPQPAQYPLQAGTPPPVDIDALIGSLSVRDKIAQLVMPWVAGSYAAFDDDAFERMQSWVDSLHVGGLIVSVGSPFDVAAKLNRLQQRSQLPLLVGSDLEAGTSIRLNGGTPFPPNMGIGATGSDSDAYEIGRVTALEGRAVGIQLAFAPVADVNNNPANPIINVRSFGEEPNTVGRLVAAEIRGIQDHGMLAVAKHFPGHGDTGTDSHIALPVLTSNWARLDSVELVPFRSAIAAGVAGIMSAHIALPGIDVGQLRPGSVAPNILTGILRDSLRFNGLVVTDALNMGGIANEYGTQAAVKAFEAGSDLLLQPADPKSAIDAMAAAIARGEITPERLDRSVRRVLELKRRLGLFTQRVVPLDSVPWVVGRNNFRDEARDMASRSLVLVKDVNGTVYSLKNAHQPLTLVTYGDEDSRSLGTILASELRGLGFGVTTFKLWPASGPASYDSAVVALERNPVSLFAVSDKPVASRGSIGLPDSMMSLISATARERPTILISLGNPYLISQLPEVGSYLIGWRSNSVTEQAVARALAGTTSISGRLPISIPPTYVRGWGLQRHVP
jgi:beta-N-acetylhexosaminidase